MRELSAGRTFWMQDGGSPWRQFLKMLFKYAAYIDPGCYYSSKKYGDFMC